MVRLLAMVAGVAGALALSQFPEFSQQYLQRLAGAVDELRVIVDNFDRAATDSGKTRDEALVELSETDFGQNLGRSLAGTIQRYERLNGDLLALEAANPLERLAQPWNMADRELFEKTLSVYQPAIPVTKEGAITTGIGFVGGWVLVGGTLGWVGRRFGRRKSRA